MGGLGNGGLNLTSYYYRENDQGVIIPRTGPFMMMDVLKNSSYTVYYYVPKKYQNCGIPKPLSPEIKQVKLPIFKYAAVKRCTDELADDTVALQIDALKRDLQGTTYQRAAARDQFTFILYNAYVFHKGYELLIWFD
ncbi:hypothetical protein C2S52_006621 [Perilla frutescens var. hirtella]|nr:hypothetical protein C2S52_006621 [Perilla frutescens var. hirtella]